MKPLLARFIPSIVSEQPLSASEDLRLWRRLTGVSLLYGPGVEDEEKVEHDGRRDIAIEMDSVPVSIAAPMSVWNPEGEAGRY